MSSSIQVLCFFLEFFLTFYINGIGYFFSFFYFVFVIVGGKFFVKKKRINHSELRVIKVGSRFLFGDVGNRPPKNFSTTLGKLTIIKRVSFLLYLLRYSLFGILHPLIILLIVKTTVFVAAGFILLFFVFKCFYLFIKYDFFNCKK